MSGLRTYGTSIEAVQPWREARVQLAESLGIMDAFNSKQMLRNQHDVIPAYQEYMSWCEANTHDQG